MMKRVCLFGMGILLGSALQAEVPLSQILFGSCLDTHEHPMLERTLSLPCGLFLFMGDNVYADKGGVAMMNEKYGLLKQSSFFKGMRAKGPILATWDDHDYGVNDGGADYPHKAEAQAAFWDWLDEPKESSRRKQEGIYHSQVFGPEGRKLQVILLDTRYFRSPLKKVPKELAMLGGSHVPDEDPSKTLLGVDQWRWLEDELRKPAALRLIVSSIQFGPEAHGGESWANLPLEKQRMLDVIGRTRAAGVIFLSGDRHWCEFSKIPGPTGYPLYDFTASSMTQTHPRGTPTKNANRFLAKTFHHANVGSMTIDWQPNGDAAILVQIVDLEGQSQLAHRLRLSELQPR